MNRSAIALVVLGAVLLALPVAGHSPANPLLEKHTGFFAKQVYDLAKHPYSAPEVPDDLSYQIFASVGYNLANSMLLIGPSGGIVVVDTLGDAETVRNMLVDFRSVSGLPQDQPLPIEAFVYTHNHIDHTGGIDGYLSEIGARKACPPAPLGQPAEAHARYSGRSQCTEVISQYKVVDAVTNTGTVIGYILNSRSAYMYGNVCEKAPEPCIVNDGIGPFVSEGLSGFRLPSYTLDQTLKLTVAGIHLFVVYVPSETNDEIMLFVPDNLNRRSGGADPETTDWSRGPGMLLSAEVIQGPSFPNLYSLRGTQFRDPATWYKSVDVLRQFDSWCMVPSHGPPLCGREDIQALLLNFRDAVQFTHDQTLRFMYRGMTPDELVGQVQMPDYLIDDLSDIETVDTQTMDPRDYLRKFYGSVPQAVREMYNGMLGWYQADPVGLNPIPPVEEAKRLVALMGGIDRVVSVAGDHEKRCVAERIDTLSECQWAAELATLVIRVDNRHVAARGIKAKAFKKLAIPEMDPNWRNWYLSSAMELEGLLHEAPAPTSGLTSPEIVAGLPPSAWVGSLSLLLKAEETAPTPENPEGVHRSMGFSFPDSLPQPGQRLVLRVRKAVAELIEVDDVEFASEAGYAAWRQADVKVEMPRGALLTLLRQQAASIDASQPKTLAELFEELSGKGVIRITEGNIEEVTTFLDLFDNRPFLFPRLTIR